MEDSDANRVTSIKAYRSKGMGIRKIASKLHVGVGTVLGVLEV